MNELLWCKCQKQNPPLTLRTFPRLLMQKLNKKSTYISVLPSIPFILLYILFYKFINQKSDFYRKNIFTLSSEEKILNKDIKLELLYTFKQSENSENNSSDKDENFNVYIINNNAQIDLIYFHGSRIKKEVHMRIVHDLAQETKCNIVMPFYRGYGTSLGKTDEISIMTDARLLGNVIRGRNKRVVVFGQSLGCAVALYFSKYFDVDKMVLENPFYNLNEVVKNFTVGRFFRWMITERWDSYKRLGNIKDILFVVSEKDKLVLGKNTDKLMKICGGKKIILKGATHLNTFKQEGYYKKIADYIK